jgi:hypothetical protein
VTDTGAPPGPADQASGLVRDGQALFAAGDVERARECFERALALVPGDEEARVGLERCARLLVEGSRPAGDSMSTPAWAGGGPADSDDSDLGAPEATVVDPLYVARLQASMPTGGEFPEPKTVPSASMPQMPLPSPAQPAKLPRISSLTPATEVSGGMVTEPNMPAARPPAASPVRVEPEYPRASPAASRHYPELLPGGRQSHPSGAHGGSLPAPPPPAPPAPLMPSGAQPAPAYPTAPPGQAPFFPTPSPMGGPLPYLGRPRRWQLILAGVGTGAALIGFLIGMAVFRGDDGATPAPAVAADAGPVTAAPVPAPTPTPTPAARVSQVVTRSASVTHPILATVTAPFDAEVTRVHGRTGATVKRKDKLFTLRPTDKKKKKDDPETLAAPEAGVFHPAVDKGATVEKEDVLGAVLDPSRFTIVIDLPPGTVTLDWACEAASADGAARAPCTLWRLDDVAGIARATATVAADAAAWLAQPNASATLTLTAR